IGLRQRGCYQTHGDDKRVSSHGTNSCSIPLKAWAVAPYQHKPVQARLPARVAGIPSSGRFGGSMLLRAGTQDPSLLRPMRPKQIGGISLRAAVGRTDAHTQRVFPTANREKVSPNPPRPAGRKATDTEGVAGGMTGTEEFSADRRKSFRLFPFGRASAR